MIQMLTEKHPDFKKVEVFFEGRRIPDAKAIVFGMHGGWRWSQKEIEKTFKEIEHELGR